MPIVAIDPLKTYFFLDSQVMTSLWQQYNPLKPYFCKNIPVIGIKPGIYLYLYFYYISYSQNTFLQNEPQTKGIVGDTSIDLSDELSIKATCELSLHE